MEKESIFLKENESLEIKSKDTFRLSPNSRIRLNTGVVITNDDTNRFLIQTNANKLLELGLIVLNPLGCISFNNSKELELLVLNISNKTIVVHFGETLATLTNLGYQVKEEVKKEKVEVKEFKKETKTDKKFKIEELIEKE